MAAIVASTCCWVPLLLIVFGAATAAMAFAGFVERFRIPIAAVSLGLLSAAACFTCLPRAFGEC